VSVRQGGLGRGLGALIPTGPLPTGPSPTAAWVDSGPPAFHPESEASPRFAQVPVESVVPNPRQPRQHFDDGAIEELVASITEVGLLQPVIVRPVGPDRYELVMGERRWRAAKAAGLASIPAIVRATPDDAMLRDALMENLHREQLNPLEEAAAYDQLLEDFGVTHEQLASRVGRSRSHVSNMVRLLQLPAPVQRRVAAGVLSAGHARALLALDSADDQERLAARIVAEGLSVRAVEELVASGDRSAPVRRTRKPPVVLADVAGRLADRLDTRVRVEMGRSKGRIVVEFATVEDLARIVDTMAPERVGQPRSADDSLSAAEGPRV
jgi:ParB family chromosome partitioning protein